MKEVFKPVPGYEGIYEVSNWGAVRSVTRCAKCVLGKRHVEAVRVIKGKIKRQFADIGGYSVVQLSKNNENNTRKVHVLVARAFISNPHNKPFVNHIDGNKQNNNVSNLEWVTGSENMQHAYGNSLISIPMAEKRHNAKFSNEQVLEIFNSAIPAKDLAKRYGVHIRTIFSIKDGSNYSSITGKIKGK